MAARPVAHMFAVEGGVGKMGIGLGQGGLRFKGKGRRRERVGWNPDSLEPS